MSERQISKAWISLGLLEKVIISQISRMKISAWGVARWTDSHLLSPIPVHGLAAHYAGASSIPASSSSFALGNLVTRYAGFAGDIFSNIPFMY